MQFICHVQCLGKKKKEKKTQRGKHIYVCNECGDAWLKATQHPNVCKFFFLIRNDTARSDVLIVVFHSIFSFCFLVLGFHKSKSIVICSPRCCSCYFFSPIVCYCWLSFCCCCYSLLFFRVFKMNKSFFKSKYNSILLLNIASFSRCSLFENKSFQYTQTHTLRHHFSFWRKILRQTTTPTRKWRRTVRKRTVRHTECSIFAFNQQFIRFPNELYYPDLKYGQHQMHSCQPKCLRWNLCRFGCVQFLMFDLIEYFDKFCHILSSFHSQSVIRASS